MNINIKIMKKTKSIFFISMLLITSCIAFAQQKEISGKVTDKVSNLVLSKVSVQASSKRGVTTNANGDYVIKVENSVNSIVFSSVGYESQTVSIDGRNIIDVALVPTIAKGEEVVVVGYGTSRKKDLTGSLVSITSKDFDKTPVTRADQYIQGRASGVQVIQSSQAPGGNVSIRIRGTNSINAGNEPLFVIDGFPGAGDLNTINPADIESIEILKDASATAIYGSRGANGVVLVSTKKGRAGKQLLSFESYYGVQSVTKIYDMMNAKEFAIYADSVVAQNNRINNTTTALPYTAAQIDNLGEGTNWQKELLRKAPMASYQLSLSGGNTDTRYALSLNYFTQQGVIINSWFKRGSIRYNFDKVISSKLKMGLTSQIAFSSQNEALVNTVGGATGGAIYDALRFNPVLPVKDSTGNYTYQNGPQPYFDAAGNPVDYALSTKDLRTNMRTLLNSFVEYEFLKGLKYKLSAGVDINNFNRDFYTPSTLYLSTQNTATGNAVKSSSTNYSWLNEHTVSYDKNINNKNRLNAVLGTSIQSFTVGQLSAAANGFFTNQLATDNIGLGATPLVPFSNKINNKLASYFGRINYTLNDRYLFTATMRADGSSRFGAGNKWGYFPSGAFAWRLIEESFVKKLNIFSDLKLRIGMGITGNQEIGSYQSLPQYSANNSYTLGGVRVVGVSIINIPNNDLSWESTASTDIGLDFGLLKGRLTGSIDFYYKKTSDLLFNSFIPTTSGFNSKLINAGSVANKGLDISANFIAIDNKDFGWTTNGNISFNRNKVLDLNGTDNLLAGNSSGSVFTGGGQPTSILRVGEPIGSFYGYEFSGIWQSQAEIAASGIKSVVRPGDPKFVDRNKDSLISGTDRSIIGNALPKYIYGFTNNFRFRRWNLNVFLQGVQGVKVFNENLYELQNGFTGTNKLKSVINSWAGEGSNNSLPRVSSVLRRGTGVTSDVIEDGSYLRIKTVSLSYDFDLINSKIVKSLNIYMSGQNIFTFTKYSGYDPEVNSYGNNSSSNNLSLNTDYNSYPASRTITFGVKMTL
jgi:TonB-dependent starch-binding outer membrane protein SusC